MSDTVSLLATPDADRFFLVPHGDDLPPGELVLDGGLRVDEAAIAPFEITREQAEAHVRAQMQQAVTSVADALAAALGQGSTDLARVAERLGLAGADPAAAEAAFRRLSDDVHAVTAAITTGEPADVDAARVRLKARGIDLGDSIERLRELDEERASEWMRRMAAELDSGDQPLGRRIDELIATLERQVGPWLGRDPERLKKQRQEEYLTGARSSIADALREAGIKPLNDPADDPSR
jgi:hypothetical protein